MNRRVWLSLGAAVLSIVLAIAAALLAFDVLRSPARVAGHDASFDAGLRSPAQTAMWNDVSVLPQRVTATVLGIEDDLAYRRTLVRFAELRPGQKEQVTNLERENAWTSLQFDLTTASREETSSERRSTLQNMLGVLTLARYSYVAPDERINVLTNALGSFRSAIELDAGNNDAKLNLELVLRLFGPTVFPAEGPGGGAARGHISGQGRTGSGY